MFQRNFCSYLFAFTRFKFGCFGISRETMCLFFEDASRKRCIHLNNLFTGNFAGIFHLYGYSQFFIIQTFQTVVVYLKFCIGKPKSEAITYRHVKGIKITIADIHTFFINFRLNISIIVGKSLCIRIIFVFVCPCIGELSGWIHLAGNNICKCISAFHARLYDRQKCFNIGKLVHKRKIYLCACIDHNDDIFVICTDICQHLVFFVFQIIVALVCLTVHTFTGDAAEHINCILSFITC